MGKLTTAQLRQLRMDAQDTMNVRHVLPDGKYLMVDGLNTFPAEAWQHYKGGVYKIEGYDIDAEDGTVRVRYYRVAGPDFDLRNNEREIIFSRRIEEWHELVDISKNPCGDGEWVPRFSPVYEATVWAPYPG